MRIRSSLALVATTLVGALAAYVPYIPEGGLGVNGTPPAYIALSDFDWQSLVRHLSLSYASDVLM